MLASSKTSYVLKLYVYEGAQYDKCSGFGQRCDVIVQSMKMAVIYNCGYHLFTYDLAIVQFIFPLIKQEEISMISQHFWSKYLLLQRKQLLWKNIPFFDEL